MSHPTPEQVIRDAVTTGIHAGIRTTAEGVRFAIERASTPAVAVLAIDELLTLMLAEVDYQESEDESA
nr:MAG TPA: hypothetical protein [Caudoviricetes sp.]